MEQAAVEIPQYRCHKVVHAAKITALHFPVSNTDGMRLLLGEIGGSVDVDNLWLGKHGTTDMVGGYYVVYDDGYTSFSPAKAFEDGYTPVPRSHQDRVRIEQQQLAEKITALTKFRDGAIFKSLPADEQVRLTDQLAVMSDYEFLLRARIAAF